jgi:hypothetical protein
MPAARMDNLSPRVGPCVLRSNKEALGSAGMAVRHAVGEKSYLTREV